MYFDLRSDHFPSEPIFTLLMGKTRINCAVLSKPTDKYSSVVYDVSYTLSVWFQGENYLGCGSIGKND